MGDDEGIDGDEVNNLTPLLRGKDHCGRGEQQILPKVKTQLFWTLQQWGNNDCETSIAPSNTVGSFCPSQPRLTKCPT